MTLKFKKIFISNKLWLWAIILVGIFLFFGINSVLAQTTDFGVSEIDQSSALSSLDIRVIIARIIRTVLGLLGIIALVIVLYGGYTIMTSGGNEEKIAKAKKILINGAIGLAIILSAFTITQFVLNALSRATRGGSGVGIEGAPPDFDPFIGSGALGGIIKDHFPFRNQTDVPRNTWITVTFREPIDPASIIENTNNSCWSTMGIITSDPAVCDPDADGTMDRPPALGDCVNPGDGFNWSVHCDQLKPEAVQIYLSSEQGTAPLPVVGASALTNYEDGVEQNAFTFTFRPINFLGNDLESMWYTVNLSSVIKKKNGDDVDYGLDDNYKWEFETGTTADFDPPTVISASPASGTTVARNKIVQINFSEPINPITAQGIINNSVGDSFTNIIFNSTTVQGEWKISNGYQTAEFFPSIPCGVNSCGDTVYCLTVACETNDRDCTQDYSTLVRTATLLDAGSNWMALPPFDGIVDMAGNALDGNNNGERDGSPARSADFITLDPAEKVPDNFFRDFIVENRIELRPPYVHQINPSVDASFVVGQVELSIIFDSPMMFYSLADIVVEEYPSNVVSEDGEVMRNFWYRPLAYTSYFDSLDKEVSKAIIQHRDFGPNNLDLFYFTSIPSTVKNDYQNCMYPGRGPDPYNDLGDNNCVYIEDESGVGSGAGCLPDETFDFTGEYYNQDTGCAHTDPDESNLTDSLSTCLDTLHSISTR